MLLICSNVVIICRIISEDLFLNNVLYEKTAKKLIYIVICPSEVIISDNIETVGHILKKVSL